MLTYIYLKLIKCSLNIINNCSLTIFIILQYLFRCKILKIIKKVFQMDLPSSIIIN